jgi:hypothetical protein
VEGEEGEEEEPQPGGEMLMILLSILCRESGESFSRGRTSWPCLPSLPGS